LQTKTDEIDNSLTDRSNIA